MTFPTSLPLVCTHVLTDGEITHKVAGEVMDFGFYRPLLPYRLVMCLRNRLTRHLSNEMAVLCVVSHHHGNQ